MRFRTGGSGSFDQLYAASYQDCSLQDSLGSHRRCLHKARGSSIDGLTLIGTSAQQEHSRSIIPLWNIGPCRYTDILLPMYSWGFVVQVPSPFPQKAGFLLRARLVGAAGGYEFQILSLPAPQIFPTSGQNAQVAAVAHVPLDLIPT